MISVLIEVLFPVFAVVAIGFIVAKTVGVEPPALTTLAYWVLGPAFIFDILATAEIESGVVLKVIASTVAGIVTVGLAAAGAMWLRGASFTVVSAAILTSIHGNVGNFGLAIVAFALGAEALPIAGIVMVTVNTVGIVTGVSLATVRHRSVLKAVWKALTSPLALAVIPALAVNLTGVALPIWVDRPVGLIAAAMIPVMLLTLGVQLAGMPRVRPSWSVAIPIALKLGLAPIVASLAVLALALTGPAADVVVLQAAMPAAVFTSLIALEHDLEPDYVTTVVLTGTLASAITLPFVISLL